MDNNEFPSNRKTTDKPGELPEGRKRVEKVVQTDGVIRKKPLGRRFREVFVAGEANSVGSYVIFEVLVPALKDVIADVVSQGIERLMFGESRSSRRGGSYRPNTTGHVSYNRYSSNNSYPWSRDRDRREDPRRQISSRSRSTHDFGEIILNTRAEAEAVIDSLFSLLERYEQATVSDLYDLVGIASNFTDEKWGWTDLRGSMPRRISNGYLLDLPRPEPLD